VILKSISQKQSSPGDVIRLYGKWGKKQEEKLPVINRGGQIRLEVLDWSDSTIRARIPERLDPGMYKVGVYCNDPYDRERGGTYYSDFMDFEIVR
jgi:hypothetical protein